MISKRDIDRVLAASKIEEVVDEKLTKSGASYKCCCPFHKEKTPSFHVFPGTNTYKCFGCGKQGKPVDYLMEKNGFTFREAVLKLAEKNNITITEEQDAPADAKQEELDRKRELMINYYRKVQTFFVKNLQDKSLEAKTAYQYATDRWGADFVDEAGIGYAFNDFSKLREFARLEHIPEEVLIEMGLLKKNEKGNVYDTFRGRIMIPIRSTSQIIISYTARLVPDVTINNNDKEAPKYLHTSNNILFNKDKTVFGLDTAFRMGASKDLFYLVEGGPDVLRLHSIGVTNAVASLGSDWTDNQLKKLQRFAHNVCLIPDIDPVKEGEKFGTGIKKVMKTGEKCLEMGFKQVTVKEICIGSKTKGKSSGVEACKIKQDPDSYFKTMGDFNKVKEMNFIVWYASKLSAAYPDDLSTNVQTIARLLSYIQVDYQVSLLIDDIKKYIKATKNVWQDAIKEAQQSSARAKIKDNGQSNKTYDAKLLEKFGFQEIDNHYVSIEDRGREFAWSNFVLRPLFHVKDIGASLRIFNIINEDGDKELIELSQEDLVSLQRFKTKIESLGNYLWLAKDEQLTAMKRYLYKSTDTAYQIRQMGWQKHEGFYAFGNGIFDGQRWYNTNEFGIVNMDKESGHKNFYLPSASSIYADDPTVYQFERRFVNKSYCTFTLREYVEALVNSFGDNAKVGFAFLLATLYRDVVVSTTKMFPILNVFGVKGTGKSELGHSLMSFFIINNTPTNIQNSTMAALAEVVAQCSNALVHIDEYKNSIDINKMEFLKGLWDGTGRSRMSIDKDKKREITQVDAGVILTGQEMPTKDIALFSRLIFLKTTMNGLQRTIEERRTFQKLLELRKQGCSHLTIELLRYRPQVEANFAASYQIAYDDLKNGIGEIEVEERLMNNWAVPLAAFHSLRNSIDVPYDYDDLLKVSAKLLVEQNEQTKDGSELASFWNIVEYLYREGLIFEKSDYKIEHVASLTLLDKDKKSYVKPIEARPVLFLRLPRILELYQRHGRETGEELIPKKTIDYYLKSDGSIYLGKSVTKRFDKIINGNPQYITKTKIVNGSTVTQSVVDETTDQPLCFDYNAVREQYGIQLRSATQSQD